MPLLGTYYCLNMIIITMSCFLNVTTVDLAAHGTRTTKTPSFTWVFYNVFARFMRMDDLVRPLKAALERDRAPSKRYDETDKWTKHQDAAASNEALAQLQQEKNVIANGQSGLMAEIEVKLAELRTFLREQRQRNEEKDRKELVAKHWKAMSLICDRIFFFVYLVIIVGSLAYTLPVLALNGMDIESVVLDKAMARA